MEYGRNQYQYPKRSDNTQVHLSLSRWSTLHEAQWNIYACIACPYIIYPNFSALIESHLTRISTKTFLVYKYILTFLEIMYLLHDLLPNVWYDHLMFLYFV